MSRPRIVVTHRIHAAVAERLREVGEVDINAGLEPWSDAALSEKLADATAMMGFMPDRMDAALLRAAPRLRIVACALKGFDNYDVAACTRAGVWLSIVPDLLTEPTAELALGLAIGLARHVLPGDALVRSGAYRGWRAQLYGSGLHGATVGIVGLGAVGRAIAARLSGFGCARVLGYDANTALSLPEPVERSALTELLAASDYVFLAAPLTATNRHMIHADTLSRCKHSQLMINVGRGSVVNEAAIAAALASGRLAGYAADVYEFEDWALTDRLPSVDHALLQAPNTLFTPHLGSAVASVRLAIEQRAADNIIALLQGREPPDALNRPLPPAYATAA